VSLINPIFISALRSVLSVAIPRNLASGPSPGNRPVAGPHVALFSTRIAGSSIVPGGHVTDRKQTGDADTPSIEAAREGSTHPSAEAGALGELGNNPGDSGAAAQDSHWRESFRDRDYVDPDRDYEYYRPAFRYGWEARGRMGDVEFEKAEAELREGWDPDTTGLSWEEASPAIRDAFQRPNTEWSDPGNPLA
jgi:hypothetical protein